MPELQSPELIEFNPRDLMRLAVRLEACAAKEDGAAEEAQAHGEGEKARQHSHRAADARYFANVCEQAYIRLVAAPAKAKRVQQSKVLGKPSREFNAFWSAYPRRKAKIDAQRAWEQMGCDAIADRIMAALSIAKASFDWKKADPKTGEPNAFIPHPATWIRRQGWLDDYASPRSSQQQTSEVDPPGWRDFLKAHSLAYEPHRFAQQHRKDAFKGWEK